jgi:hypothetical protein
MADTPQGGLFEDDPGMQATAAPVKAPVNGIARVHMPDGVQLEMRVSEDYRARVVWAWVEQADLSRMYAGIRAVEGGSGRSWPIGAGLVPRTLPGVGPGVRLTSFNL